MYQPENYNPQRIGIGFGQADGSFALTEYRAPGDPEFGYGGGGVLFSKSADFNGDGRDEIIITDHAWYSNPYIDFFTTDATRQAPVLAHYVEDGGYLSDIWNIDDLNGDGLPDLLTEDYTLFNLGGGYQFERGDAVYIDGMPFGAQVAFFHDVNGDGIDDIGLREMPASGSSLRNCVVYQGIGQYQFAFDTPIGQCPRITVAVGDFNGDGIADYLGLRETRKRVVPTPSGSEPVYTLSQRVYMFAGKRHGGFAPEELYGVIRGGPFTGIDVRDFDGDGKDDALIATARTYANESGVFNPDIYYSPGYVTMVKGH